MALSFVPQNFQFLYNNGIKHNTSPPYHSASNGFAQNSVKSLKHSILKSLQDNVDSNVFKYHC